MAALNTADQLLLEDLAVVAVLHLIWVVVVAVTVVVVAVV
jgi:hypothetical protein